MYTAKRFYKLWLYVVLIGILLIACDTSLIRAEGATPLYAVVFPFKNSIRMAEMQSNGEWMQNDLPNALYGRYEDSYFEPVWSSDGRTLYYTALTPDGSKQYRDIYAYDVRQHTSTLVVSLPKKREEEAGDTAHIDLSPDGRYLWLSRWSRMGSVLIDLQAPLKQRIRLQTKCETRVLGWFSHSLTVQEMDVCDPFRVFDIDLATGTIVHEQPVLDDQGNDIPAFANFEEIAWHGIDAKQPYLLGENPSGDGGIFRFQPASGALSKLFDGEKLMILEDKTAAVFQSKGQLMWLDLVSMTAQPLQGVSALDGIVSQSQFNNTFNFWQATPSDAPVQIDHISLNKAGLSRQTWYKGPPLVDVCIDASAHAQAILVMPDCHAKTATYRLYNSNGVLVWASSRETTSIQQALGKLQPTPQILGTGWSETDDWYHFWLLDNPNNSDDPSSPTKRPERTDFAVNANTGKTLRAPHQGSQYTSASPDGKWWLYAVLDKSDPSKDTVEVYNIVSGATVILSKGALLSVEIYEFQFPIYASWKVIQ